MNEVHKVAYLHRFPYPHAPSADYCDLGAIGSMAGDAADGAARQANLAALRAYVDEQGALPPRPTQGAPLPREAPHTPER
jgi:hypothetical protein